MAESSVCFAGKEGVKNQRRDQQTKNVAHGFGYAREKLHAVPEHAEPDENGEKHETTLLQSRRRTATQLSWICQADSRDSASEPEAPSCAKTKFDWTGLAPK